MFSSSTKICLFFLSIFILFQLNNGDELKNGGCPGGVCRPHPNCARKNDICSGEIQCCDKLICKGGKFCI